MTSQVTDVLETVQSFVAKGYNREYRVKDGNLVDLDLGSTLDPCALRIDAALRLESGSDAEDASNIYAITDPATGHKGLLIDAFDVFDEMCHRDLSERLVAHRETVPAGDQDVPSKLLFDDSPEAGSGDGHAGRGHGKILGGGMVGTHAGDMIGEVALAIEMGADEIDIGKTIHPHPTLGESIGMAAEVAHGSCTDLPPQKKR